MRLIPNDNIGWYDSLQVVRLTKLENSQVLEI